MSTVATDPLRVRTGPGASSLVKRASERFTALGRFDTLNRHLGQGLGNVVRAGSAILSAVVYYHPFDVVVWNGEVIGPKHPMYELDLVMPLPFAVVGYLIPSRT